MNFSGTIDGRIRELLFQDYGIDKNTVDSGGRSERSVYERFATGR